MKIFFSALKRLSLVAVGKSLLQVFGVLWLMIEISSFFSEPVSQMIRTHWWLFIIFGLIVGMFFAWPRLRITTLIPGTDCFITIRVCDIFSLTDTAYVVGTNCTFDTAIEDGTISLASVQGQLTKKYFDSVDQLDREIANSLKSFSGKAITPNEKPYGKLMQYDVGTVAAVSSHGRRAYLVAIARLNFHRVAHATRSDLMDALPLLWESIRTRGGLEPLCCPILGSGFSRLDATREELIGEIVKSFIPAVRAGMFCHELTIAVNPKDFAEGHVNLKKLEAFIQHECTYGSAAFGSSIQQPIGIAQD